MTSRTESETSIESEETILLSDISSERLLSFDVELVRSSVGVRRSSEGALGKEEGEFRVRVFREIGREMLVKVSGWSEDVERLLVSLGVTLLAFENTLMNWND